jgi:anti-sigma B factor antagonist
MTDFEITQVSPERYRLSGELDMASAETLRDALQPVVEANGRLVLDVEAITFIDSSGLRALVQLSQQMDGAGPLILSEVPSSVRRLLDVVGLEAIPGIEVVDDG